MSVLNPISILPYAGLNATGPYAITFDVFLDDGGNAKDITVLLLSGGEITDITSTSTFTGKNVYTSASYPPSDTVVLLRDPLFTQPYVYSGVTQFPGRTIEKTYDRLLFLIQRLRLDVERSLKFPLTDLPARDMPAKALMALRGLFFDTDGEATPTGGLTNIPISSAMEPVVTALTLALARVALDVYEKPIVDAIQAAAAAAQASANNAQATADGKIVTFYQATEPTEAGLGDLWLDTDNDRLFRWSGAEWIEIQDTDIAQAIADAATAQSTADGKIVTFYQDGIPTATDVGDLWVDTNDKNRLYRAASIGAKEIKAGEWELARDTDIAQAISDAATAQATADGKIITFYQDGIPTSTDIGDLWIDTNDGNKLYRAEMVGANEIKAGEWVEIQDDDIAQAIANAATAQSTADGKIVTFYQTSAPTAEGVGDIWIDTDDDNKPYRWSGTEWVSIRDEVVIIADRIEVGTIGTREMSYGSDVNKIPVYEDADPASPAAEIFDLSQPDCVGSRGTIPEAGKEIVYAPPTAIDEVLRKFRGFHSPRMYGQSEAIFQTATNLLKSPEDLTTADWTNVNSTDVPTDQYVDGKRLTKVINSGANAGYVWQTHTTAFTQVTVAGSVIVRKGSTTGNAALLRVRDDTAPFYIFTLTVDFDNYPNAPGIPGVGTLHNYTWIDENTIEIQWTGTLGAAGNDVQVRCYGSPAATDGEYTYWTTVQLEDLIYPTPYIDRYRWPTGIRPAVSPNYPVTMPEKFVFKVKIRPWFIYDTNGYPRFAEWYIDAAHRFMIYWERSNDTIRAYWKDGGTEKYLISEVFDDSGVNDLNQEIVLFGAIDLSTQTGNNVFFAIVNGTKQAEDNDWGGAPDALASTFSTLSIGHENAAAHADSLIEYVKFWTWDGVSLGTLADETDIDRVTADLTSLFDLTLEDYTLARYKPVSKQGAIGIFQKTKNLVDFSEDLTDASWLDENANITPSLSDYSINGKRFTKLLITDANPAFTYKDVEVTTATPSFQAIFIYGLSDVTVIDLTERGVATRGTITITWSTKTIAVADGATNLEYEWITDKKVWVAATAAAVVIANDVEIHIYPDTTEANLDHIYVTAVMVEDIAYPTPYTPTERVKDGVLNYPFEMPEKFSVCFWMRPWFTYSTAIFHRFIEWYVDGTHRFRFCYDPPSDCMNLVWNDGGITRLLWSQQFDDGSAFDDINQWIFVAAAIDLSAQSQIASLLKVYADTIGKDANWGGIPDAKTSALPTLSVGHSVAGASEADSFISDLMILPNVLLTEEQMDRHYNTRRPWYSLSEVASFDRQVRIDRNGIRLHNAELNITDWRNRQILISNRDGLMAKDAAGNIIHDIADAPILINHYYCGHPHWFDELVSYILLNTATPASRAWTDLVCLDVGNTNAQAGIFKINSFNDIAPAALNYVLIYLRPDGEDWTPGSNSATPSYAVRGTPLTHIGGQGLLFCPIGPNNTIEYYFAEETTNKTGCGLTIAQLGVLI